MNLRYILCVELIGFSYGCCGFFRGVVMDDFWFLIWVIVEIEVLFIEMKNVE